MALGLVHDAIFAAHDPGSYHPESPQRLIVLEKHLASWPRLCDTETLPVRPASKEELLLVHRPEHLSRIASTDGRCMALDPDTMTSPQSYHAALDAAGSLIDLCDAALDGKVQSGVALVRPPGHHATPQRAMGFCLFNNIAIAAAHLVVNRGLKRVMIVDWDVHHGNGTEDAFYEDDRVLYFSTHQYPFYPGTGPVGATGASDGKGYNINVPLSAGHGDPEYVRIFQDLLLPVARQYKPQFILVSAGYDAHRGDPLGGMRLSSQGFAALAQTVMEIAGEFCPGKVVLTLEGGYDPESQARAMLQVMEVLLGADHGQLLRHNALNDGRPPALAAAMEAAAPYWELR